MRIHAQYISVYVRVTEEHVHFDQGYFAHEVNEIKLLTPTQVPNHAPKTSLID